MEERVEIIKNQSALNYQLVWFSVAYLILGSLSIVILLIPFDFMESRFVVWTLIIIGLALLMYVVSIWMLKQTWKSSKYYLTKDCLIISRGLGTIQKDIFRYDTMATVSVKQKRAEKMRGYGKILINIPDHSMPVVLKDINNPTEVATKLQNNIIKATRLNYSV